MSASGISMPELGKEFVAVLVFLLPGFLCAWIFYGFTSYPKPSQFERVVEALIYTFLIHAVAPVARWTLEWVGSVTVVLRPWDAAAEGLTSFVLAVGLGSALVYFTNKDSVHKWMRERGFTSRTSHPSEWFYVFSQKITFVILHMTDGRRLYGWPKEWPVEAGKGQFYIQLPAWIQPDGKPIELPQLDGVLVSATDVKWVEFLAPTGSEKT